MEGMLVRWETVEEAEAKLWQAKERLRLAQEGVKKCEERVARATARERKQIRKAG